jgi:general secretion pathway protein I
MTKASAAKEGGFTLLEVMVALAILGFALAVLIKSTAQNINAAEQSHLMGIATDLARGKMYEIEEKLLKDGFTDTDQSQTDLKPFDDEGWPNIYYSYKVDQVELPDFDQLQAMAQGKANAMAGSGSGFGSGSASLGSGFGSDQVGGFQNSMLGGMLNMFGGGGGGASASSGVTGAAGGALIQSQYSMFQQILKVSVRKVTLTVTWKVMGDDNSMKVVCYFTDASAMDKVLNGMGTQDLDDVPQGSGAGSGIGSAGGVTRPTTPVGGGK